MDMTYIPWVTSVDPDLPAHLCSVIWIYIVYFMVRNILMNLKAAGVDPDQTAQIYRLIGIYIAHPCEKTVTEIVHTQVDEQGFDPTQLFVFSQHICAI
jgi:hypothetical protein